jgi:hypothetical protein
LWQAFSGNSFDSEGDELETLPLAAVFLVYMLSPLPRHSGWAHSFAHSPNRISLPRKGCRVGLRIVLFEMLWGGGKEIAHIVADVTRWRPPMQKPNDLNQSRIVLKQDSTLIAVIEMSLSSWLVAGIVPGVERQPLKKLAVDESALLKLLNTRAR